MNHELAEALRAGRGLVRTGDVGRHTVAHARRAGRVVVPHRGVLLAAPLVDDRHAMLRAALARAGPTAALSHTSALEAWGVPVPLSPEVHVTTGSGRRLRAPGIIAHRRAGFIAEPPQTITRNGLPTTRLEQSLVDSWSLVGRAPVLFAIAEWMTTVDRIRRALASSPSLRGLARFRTLLDKLAQGCRSELELWGYDHVLTGPDMPPLRRQFPVAIGRSRIVYLDLVHEETRTNIELDGATYHGTAAQRECDLRRDAALAILGFLVVRFSHRRLTSEPEAVRTEVRAIICARSA